MRIKLFLFSMPIAIACLFLVAFLVAREGFNKKLNELVLSSSGDADKLNPILANDSASGDINDLVFNGLLKYSQDLEIIGDLAESWTVAQNSWFYLDPKSGLTLQAAVALLRSPANAKRLEAAKITTVSAPEARGAGAPESIHPVSLALGTAGREYEQTLLRIIPEQKILPVNILRVGVDTGATFKGEKASAPALINALREPVTKALQGQGALLGYIVGRSDTFTVKFLGDAAPVTKAINEFGEKEAPAPEKDKPKEPLCRVTKTEKRPFENEPVITFTLRKAVRWHDGEPFTSADVKFTYDMIMDERTNTVRRPMFELVKLVETPSPYTVRVTYKEPFSPCLENWTMGIIPKHLLDPEVLAKKKEAINSASFNRNPVGTGPFKFLEWKTDERITLVANDDYFRGRPALDRISVRVIPEPELRLQEFMIGGVDVDTIQPHSYARFKEDPRYVVYKRPSNSYNYIGWNEKLEDFKDPRVRQALCLAINREEMLKYLLYGLGVVSNGIYPPQMWYYNPNVKPLPYDPHRAKELLAEAGWRDTDGDGILDKNGKPFKFDLITNNGNPIRSDIAVLVQRQLKQVGIDVKIYLYEWAVFVRDKINPRNFEACVLGWSLGLDPDVYEIWHSSQGAKGLNFVGYSNPRADELIELGRTEFDREKRKAIYQELSAIIYKDQPYTFLFFGQETPALHRGAFKRKMPQPDGSTQVEDIEMTKAGLLYYMDRWFRVGGAPGALQTENPKR